MPVTGMQDVLAHRGFAIQHQAMLFLRVVVHWNHRVGRHANKTGHR
jgi:hypothetical protein